MDKNRKIEIYKEMVFLRKFEEKAGELYEQGKIRGFLHLYIGQEAVATGFLEPIRPDDYVMGSYRDHGQALSRCADPRKLMAELFGKSTGISSGKGGSMHLFDKDRRFLGGTAIVGGGLPIAAGVGFTIKYRGGDQVCLCFFGDGAINEGAFHESLNIAALWGLPVLFICENNLYGMGTAVARASAIPTLFRRAQCYAIETYSVDGMDVEAVTDVAEKCISQIRKTGQPIFVEATTYRYRGHSMSDPETYRPKEEIEDWKKRDPILVYAKKLIKSGILNEKKKAKIEEECLKQIAEAVEFAELSPLPKTEDLYTNIYA